MKMRTMPAPTFSKRGSSASEMTSLAERMVYLQALRVAFAVVTIGVGSLRFQHRWRLRVRPDAGHGSLPRGGRRLRGPSQGHALAFATHRRRHAVDRRHLPGMGDVRNRRNAEPSSFPPVLTPDRRHPPGLLPDRPQGRYVALASLLRRVLRTGRRDRSRRPMRPPMVSPGARSSTGSLCSTSWRSG